MIPIVCIVGASNVGKTTFLEQLIPALLERGYRVGTLKHDVHGFEMDREGKDTWRHRKAGAQAIAISSPAQIAIIRQTEGELGLEEIAGRYFSSEDLLLTEGYKRSHYPKIEIFRRVVENSPICGPKDNLLAIVTDENIASDTPCFGFDEVAKVADMIEGRFLKDRKRPGLLVHLDGKQLPMKEFVQDFVIGGIIGMLSTLRGWKKSGKVDIQIRPGSE
jgi:molybdopterin-guanine dinucleotide biosynthesis adapter protein